MTGVPETSRVARGRPDGGQFAPGRHQEVDDLDLAPADDRPLVDRLVRGDTYDITWRNEDEFGDVRRPVRRMKVAGVGDDGFVYDVDGGNLRSSLIESFERVPSAEEATRAAMVSSLQDQLGLTIRSVYPDASSIVSAVELSATGEIVAGINAVHDDEDRPVDLGAGGEPGSPAHRAMTQARAYAGAIAAADAGRLWGRRGRVLIPLRGDRPPRYQVAIVGTPSVATQRWLREHRTVPAASSDH